MIAVEVPAFLSDGRHYKMLLQSSSTPGWVFSSCFAAYVGVAKTDGLPDGDRPDGPSHALAELMTMPRVPVLADLRFLREPFSPGEEDAREFCLECDASSGTCVCNCGNEHKCKTCKGQGRIGPEPRKLSPGCRKFISYDKTITVAISDALGQLLDRLRISVIVTDNIEKRMVVGCNQSGAPLVFIAPLRPDDEEGAANT